jgi:cardiolipin synthase
VRVLLDGLGSIKVPDEDFEPLVKAGGKVQKFRAPRFGKLTRFHRRNHRRSIVIDGEIGFTGGMAVSDIWLGNAQDTDHWRDIMFKVTGPLARSLQTAFADLWVSSSGELLIDPKNYAVAAPAATAGVDRFIHLANSPADDDESMAYFFLLPILSARESIYFAAPYFIPDNHLQAALVEKAKSGVDVRLLLPGPHTDNWITRASAQARYQELLEAGAKVYEYQPTFMARQVRRRRWQMGHHRLAEPELAIASPRRRKCARHLRRRVWHDAQSHILQGSRAGEACQPRGMAPPEPPAEILRNNLPDIGPAVLTIPRSGIVAAL